jgi:tetratricopeptide (TPR) repeat protein
MSRVITIVFLVVSLAASVAWAGAREHFQAGQSYYAQGRYEKAIDEFEEAYRLDPKPLLLQNIAQAWEKLGNLPKAVEYFERYLKEDREADDRQSLEDKIEVLKERINATGIKVTCNEKDATIYVDDIEAGRTPVPRVIPLAVGAHKVRVSKPGFRDFVMQIAVSTGLSVPVDAQLESDGSAPAVAAASEEAGEPTEDEDEEEEDEEEEGAGSSVEPLDVIPWVIAGVGGAAAIVGLGVLGGMAAGDDDHDKAIIAYVVGWPGVALAVGGTTWGLIRILTKKDGEAEPEAEAEVAVMPLVDGGTTGVAAAVTF